MTVVATLMGVITSENFEQCQVTVINLSLCRCVRAQHSMNTFVFLDLCVRAICLRERACNLLVRRLLGSA